MASALQCPACGHKHRLVRADRRSDLLVRAVRSAAEDAGRVPPPGRIRPGRRAPHERHERAEARQRADARLRFCAAHRASPASSSAAAASAPAAATRRVGVRRRCAGHADDPVADHRLGRRARCSAASSSATSRSSPASLTGDSIIDLDHRHRHRPLPPALRSRAVLGAGQRRADDAVHRRCRVVGRLGTTRRRRARSRSSA